MGKIEAHTLAVYKLSRLLHMGTEHLAQSGLHKMGRGVVSHGGLSDFTANLGRDIIRKLKGSPFHLAYMKDNSLGVLCGCFDTEYSSAPVCQPAAVACLTAAFSVKRCFIQYNNSVLSLGGKGRLFAPVYNDLYPSVTIQGVVSNELGLFDIKLHSAVVPCLGSGIFTGVSGTLFLLLHELFKALLVNRHSLFLENILGQIKWESVGIIKLKSVGSGNFLGLGGLGKLIKQLHTLVNGASEALLLFPYHPDNKVFFLGKLGICLVFLNNSRNHLRKEGSVNAEQTAVSCSTADKPAQNISSTLVRRHNSVPDHHGCRTDVVGYNTERNIGFGVLLICDSGNSAYVLHNFLHRIDLEKVIHPLHNAGQAFETHSGINIGMIKRGIISLAVGIKLGEHKVPNLYIPVAVTAHGAGGLSAGILFSSVKMYFRTWSAGTRSVLPEIIFLAKSDNAVR